MSNPILNGQWRSLYHIATQNTFLSFSTLLFCFLLMHCQAQAQYPVKVLKNLNTRNFSNASPLHEYQNSLLFASAQGVADPTALVTTYALFLTNGEQVVRLKEGFIAVVPEQFTNAAGLVFFKAATENESGLWVTDGTAAGTFLVKAADFVDNLYAFNGQLLFTATTATDGNELWISNGTTAGTQLLKDINVGSASANPQYFNELNGKAIFTANNGVHGNRLWATDGTTAGTFLLSTNAEEPLQKTLLNNQLYFVAEDATHGQELWTTDGTDDGTVLLKDIRVGNQNSFTFGYELVKLNDQLFFTANDGINGTELWQSDGTTNGTQLFKEFTNGSGSSRFSDFGIAAGQLFFNVKSTINDPFQLWKTDGTAAGTILLQTVENVPGFVETSAKNFTAFAGKVFFQSSGNGTGLELWVTNGTPAGTFLYNNLYINQRFCESCTSDASARPENLFVFNNRLFFYANSDRYGQEYFYIDNNNTCKQALKLPATSEPKFKTFSNILATASGVDQPNCLPFTSSYKDVWFETTVPPSGNITIETGQVSSGLTNTVLQVFAGSCNSLKQVACDISSGEGFHTKVELTNRTAGERLYIRVGDFGNNNLGNFSISITGDCVCAANGQPDNVAPQVVGYSPNRAWTDFFQTVNSRRLFLELSNDTLYYARSGSSNPLLSFTSEDVIITDNCPTNPIDIQVEEYLGSESRYCEEQFVVWVLTDACGNTSRDTLHVRVGCAANELEGISLRNINNGQIEYQILNDGNTTPIKLSCEQVDAFFDPSRFFFSVDIGFSCNGGESTKFRRARRTRNRQPTPGLCYSEIWVAESETLACADCVNGKMVKIIEVSDDQAPLFIVPPDISLSCQEDFTDLSLTGQPTNAIDNCGVQSINFNDTYFGSNDCVDNYIIQRDWMVKDSCNNVTTKTQTITLLPDGSNSSIQFWGVQLDGAFYNSVGNNQVTFDGGVDGFIGSCTRKNFTISATTDCVGGVTATLLQEIETGDPLEGACCYFDYLYRLTDNCGNSLDITVSTNSQGFSFDGFKFLPNGVEPADLCGPDSGQYPIFQQNGQDVQSGDVIVLNCQDDLSNYENLYACFSSQCNASGSSKFRRARRLLKADLCQQERWEWDDDIFLIFEYENCPVNLNIIDDPIATGIYLAEQQITAAHPLAQAANVTFLAGHSIQLNSGFSTENATTFTALVQPFENCSGSTTERSSAEESVVESVEKSIFKAFPNPATDFLNIEFQLTRTNQNVVIELVNINGQVMKVLFSDLIPSTDKQHFSIPLASQTGVYFIRLQTEQETLIQKIFVLR
ncbi:MAG: T9SS type A sorting domain-containing protein [Saprospiraceae bacterium]